MASQVCGGRDPYEDRGLQRRSQDQGATQIFQMGDDIDVIVSAPTKVEPVPDGTHAKENEEGFIRMLMSNGLTREEAIHQLAGTSSSSRQNQKQPNNAAAPKSRRPMSYEEEAKEAEAAFWAAHDYKSQQGSPLEEGQGSGNALSSNAAGEEKEADVGMEAAGGAGEPDAQEREQNSNSNEAEGTKGNKKNFWDAVLPDSQPEAQPQQQQEQDKVVAVPGAAPATPFGQSGIPEQNLNSAQQAANQGPPRMGADAPALETTSHTMNQPVVEQQQQQQQMLQGPRSFGAAAQLQFSTSQFGTNRAGHLPTFGTFGGGFGSSSSAAVSNFSNNPPGGATQLQAQLCGPYRAPPGDAIRLVCGSDYFATRRLLEQQLRRPVASCVYLAVDEEEKRAVKDILRKEHGDHADHAAWKGTTSVYSLPELLEDRDISRERIVRDCRQHLAAWASASAGLVRSLNESSGRGAITLTPLLLIPQPFLQYLFHRPQTDVSIPQPHGLWALEQISELSAMLLAPEDVEQGTGDANFLQANHATSGFARFPALLTVAEAATFAKAKMNQPPARGMRHGKQYRCNFGGGTVALSETAAEVFQGYEGVKYPEHLLTMLSLLFG
eukprot:g1849.t1